MNVPKMERLQGLDASSVDPTTENVQFSATIKPIGVLDDFHNVIDLLRNEKPIFLLFAGVGPGFENTITTQPEQVGEGERV